MVSHVRDYQFPLRSPLTPCQMSLRFNHIRSVQQKQAPIYIQVLIQLWVSERHMFGQIRIQQSECQHLELGLILSHQRIRQQVQSMER